MKQSKSATTDFSRYRVIGWACSAIAILTLLLLAFLLESYQGLTAASLAFAVCLFAVFMNRSLILFLPGNRITPAHCTLIGMLLRMALPLGLCMVLAVKQSPLLDQGFAYYLIISYLIVLIADVSTTLFKLKMEPAT